MSEARADETARVLDALVTRPAAIAPLSSLDDWWQAHRACAPVELEPAARAVLGGFVCDRLGYAFAAGYTEAMRRVGNPAEPLDLRRRALCATEQGGGHPRAIECELAPAPGGPTGAFVLRGTKTFVTLGDAVDELVVVASRGLDPASGRKRLVAVRVSAQAEGVTLTRLPALAFVPEIPHASVRFEGVRVDAAQVLDGDGYAAVLKPFRTVEDCHVFLAALAWLTRVGREASWPAETIERGLAAIASLLTLARTREPLSVGVHRALGGALASAQAHVEALEREGAWDSVAPELRARWQRDRPLLSIAAKVRARRLEAARGQAK